MYENVNGQETYFLYDGHSNKVIAEIDALGALKKYYSWSPTGHLLSLTVDGVAYYTVHNGYGDIIQLTDENGTVVASYNYDAWGNIISETGSAAALNPYRYAGYRFDDVTGLYYLSARYYAPSLGRFLSRDPLFSNNLYLYSNNNPLMYVDPTGYYEVKSDLDQGEKPQSEKREKEERVYVAVSQDINLALFTGTHSKMSVYVSNKWNLLITFTPAVIAVTNWEAN